MVLCVDVLIDGCLMFISAKYTLYLQDESRFNNFLKLYSNVHVGGTRLRVVQLWYAREVTQITIFWKVCTRSDTDHNILKFLLPFYALLFIFFFWSCHRIICSYDSMFHIWLVLCMVYIPFCRLVIWLLQCVFISFRKNHMWSLRRVWRYQSGNQNPYIKEEQTTQWPNEKR